jgi:large subunit ribosomal protein L18
MNIVRQNKTRLKRKLRNRKALYGTADRPRVSVSRSNKHLQAQAIDDLGKRTIIGISDITVEKGNKTEKAKELGKRFVDVLKKNNIETIIFDRGAYKYHGRVKAFAESIREAGIKF